MYTFSVLRCCIYYRSLLDSKTCSPDVPPAEHYRQEAACQWAAASMRSSRLLWRDDVDVYRNMIIAISSPGAGSTVCSRHMKASPIAACPVNMRFKDVRGLVRAHTFHVRAASSHPGVVDALFVALARITVANGQTLLQLADRKGVRSRKNTISASARGANLHSRRIRGQFAHLLLAVQPTLSRIPAVAPKHFCPALSQTFRSDRSPGVVE